MSGRLAELSDDDVRALLESDSAPTVGFGGITSTAVVDGVPVFVKRVPLTDLERRPENVGSTANLFGLPTFYQYGIGSAGFGVWRELAVHAMTTQWVLDGSFAGFPVLYHWRVLPQEPRPMDPAELERWVAHWDGAEAVRARLEAIGHASAAVVLFMEHIPKTLDEWLASADESAYEFTQNALREGARFMREKGLVHFDAHFRNLLTDGHRVYFADFGLANHTDFDLDADESAFLHRHRGYDHFYTIGHLCVWLVSKLLNLSWPESHAYLRDRGPDVALPGVAGRIVARHASVTAVLDDFFVRLTEASKRTPYPVDKLSW